MEKSSDGTALGPGVVGATDCEGSVGGTTDTVGSRVIPGARVGVGVTGEED